MGLDTRQNIRVDDGCIFIETKQVNVLLKILLYWESLWKLHLDHGMNIGTNETAVTKVRLFKHPCYQRTDQNFTVQEGFMRM